MDVMHVQSPGGFPQEAVLFSGFYSLLSQVIDFLLKLILVYICPKCINSYKYNFFTT